MAGEVADATEVDARCAHHERPPVSQDRRPPLGWNPTGRPPRHNLMPVPTGLMEDWAADDDTRPQDWTLVAIHAASDLGAVRMPMTYGRSIGTSAGFYIKAGRTLFMEGQNEPAVADHVEMMPRYLSIQMKPFDIVFRRADGKVIHRYVDVGLELDDHSVRFGEIKTDGRWFSAPKVSRPLDRIDLALGSVGIAPLLRIKGWPLRRDETLEAHEIAMSARTTVCQPGEDLAARRAVTAAGGRTTYAEVASAIGGARADAADKLYSMLQRRIVAFDLDREPHDGTFVTAPAPATAFALRETLARFAKRQAA